MLTSSRMIAVQREASAFGRRFRADLLSRYEQEYGETAPPPAIIGAEVAQDFLGAKVVFDPLPLHLFGETTIRDGSPLITMNSLTGQIEGVKDPRGVQGTGIWHEMIHVERDLHILRVGPQATLPGMVIDQTIACHRATAVTIPGRFSMHEYFAEVAGRAAAVSYPHLLKTDSFSRFANLARRHLASNQASWRLLYDAAQEIGVNISALVKQLGEDGLLAVERSEGRSILYPQPTLAEEMESIA